MENKTDQEIIEEHALVREAMEPMPGKVYEFTRIDEGGKEETHKIRVELVPGDETLLAFAGAKQLANKLGEVPNEYGDIYTEACHYELLQRALRRPEKRKDLAGREYYPYIFTSAQQCRRSLHEGEAVLLLNFYEMTKAEYSGLVDYDPSEIDMWISRLADPLSSAFFLSQLQSAELPALLKSLAERARELSQTLGLTLPDWRDTLESAPEKSESNTTSSPGHVSGHFKDSSGDEGVVDLTKVVSRSDATREVQKKRRRNRKKKKT